MESMRTAKSSKLTGMSSRLAATSAPDRCKCCLVCCFAASLGFASPVACISKGSSTESLGFEAVSSDRAVPSPDRALTLDLSCLPPCAHSSISESYQSGLPPPSVVSGIPDSRFRFFFTFGGILKDCGTRNGNTEKVVEISLWVMRRRRRRARRWSGVDVCLKDGLVRE